MGYRRPYVREVKATWWKDHPFYRFYMLREATVLPLIFFTLMMTWGLVSLAIGPNAFSDWQSVMAHPLVVVLNLVALAGSLLHAFTFFKMFPQVMPIQLKGKRVPAALLVGGQWAVMVFMSLLVLCFIIF